MNTMYAIAERNPTIGSPISRDNGRRWLNPKGVPTPASNEAAEYETHEEAAAAAEDAGIEISESSCWAIVEVEE